jgi:alpha-glucosidase (family GH31 glycosyl hydrolase)
MQFMTGSALLVAPVYENTTTRDGIYLPAGEWFDYWSGEAMDGNTTIDGYSAPLEILPVFVKAGSIIPMWPGEDLSVAGTSQSASCTHCVELRACVHPPTHTPVSHITQNNTPANSQQQP